MLKLINRCAASKVEENAPEKEIDSPETSALLREIASNSIVLLKNERQVLPLSKSKPASSISCIPESLGRLLTDI
jgi:beta-glucosidase